MTTLKVLGMMSGTSGDAIDGALMEFSRNGNWQLLWFDSCPFSSQEFARIKKLMQGADAREVTLGASYMAELYAHACRQFFADKRVRPDYIAAHGQTVYHHPHPENWDGIKVSGSLQLLNGSLLAQRSGIPVICDFRSADMAVGGQGAPLVPYADLYLFGRLAKRDLFLLNIGGMANISVIRAGKSPELLCAFDTGPGNVLMDAAVQQAGLGNYDGDGKLAASGTSCRELVERFLADPYFAAPPPKSTGRELFHAGRLAEINGWNHGKLSATDLLATLLDITVDSIADAIRSLSETVEFPADLVVSGGGALNQELMRRLAVSLNGICKVAVSDSWGVPVMAKEAMAFAVLGHSFVRGEPANMPAATGATCPVILGALYPV